MREHPRVEDRLHLREEVRIEHIGGVVLVVDEVLAAHGAAHPREPRGLRRDLHVAVGAGVHPAGQAAVHDVLDALDHERARVLVRHDVRAAAVHRGGEDLVDRDLDALTLPIAHRGAQRAHHHSGDDAAGEELRRVEPQLDRLALGVAGDLHHAPGGVEQHVVGLEVPIRAVLAEARDTHERGRRVRLGEHVRADAEPFERAGPEALDDDVGFGGEPQQQVTPGRGVEVQRNAALPRVEVQEHPAGLDVGLVARERAEAPRSVAATGALDLGDLGAVVRKQLCCVRSRDPLREVEDARPLERSCHARVPALRQVRSLPTRRRSRQAPAARVRGGHPVARYARS